MSPVDALAARISMWTGLDLGRGGRRATLDRLIAQRTRALGLASADAYVSLLASDGSPEVRALVDALTVGHTWFFRDDEQNAVFVDVMRTQQRDPLHVWIAGCSTGEEAYTIALLAASAKRRVSVLATDINARALEAAAAGEYGAWSLRNVRDDVRATFTRTGEGRWSVPSSIRSLVRFERHNLLDAPKTREGGWDLVLCRNVLIYFDRDAVTRTIAKLAGSLAPNGWLFLGASEVLSAAPAGFAIGSTNGRFGIRRARKDEAPLPSVAPPPPAVMEERQTASELLEQALANVERGAATEAMSLVLRALAIDPLSVDARVVGGIGLYTSGDPTRAIEELRAALFLDPEQWVASFYLARTYEKLGRIADAKLEYRRAVERATTPPRLRTLRAWQDEMLQIARARA
jgi:chemotaxis protein methyltransferase CheR